MKTDLIYLYKVFNPLFVHGIKHKNSWFTLHGRLNLQIIKNAEQIC